MCNFVKQIWAFKGLILLCPESMKYSSMCTQVSPVQQMVGRGAEGFMWRTAGQIHLNVEKVLITFIRYKPLILISLDLFADDLLWRQCTAFFMFVNKPRQIAEEKCRISLTLLLALAIWQGLQWQLPNKGIDSHAWSQTLMVLVCCKAVANAIVSPIIHHWEQPIQALLFILLFFLRNGGDR